VKLSSSLIDKDKIDTVPFNLVNQWSMLNGTCMQFGPCHLSDVITETAEIRPQ